MNNTSIISLVSVLALAGGCATSQKKVGPETEAALTKSVGADVRWLREDSDFHQSETAVNTLLEKDLTVDAAVQIALLNSRRLQAELEEIGVARAELLQVGLLRNPEFSASWKFPDRPPSSANAEYSLTGELLDLIFLPYRKKLARQNVDQTQLRVADAILELAREVKVEFYGLQAQQQLLERLKLIEEVNEAAADLAKRKHDAGNISDLELAQHQAVFAQSRIAHAQTQKEFRRDQQAFNRRLGLWGANTKWKISPRLPDIPNDEITLDGLESMAMEQRRDLAALKARTDAVSAALALKRKTRFSPLGIQVGVESEREPDKTWLTGPSVSFEVPIFDQGQGAIAQLTSEQRIAQRTFEALAIDIRSEVNGAIDELIANRDLAEFYGKRVLPQQIQIVNETLLQYNAMQISTFELLSAKERQLEAEREYVEAWRDYWIARADLERAVGGRLNLTSTPSEKTGPSNPQKTHDHHNH